MANFFKLTTILSLTILLLLASWSPLVASSSSIFDHLIDQEDDEEYVLDVPVLNPTSRSSRLLGSTNVIKKGTRCYPLKYNVCNGVWADKGKSFLHCCKNHCRNVLGDKNNCGVGTSASSASVVAVENVPMLIIVASVTRNVKVVWVVSMDTVVMHS